MTPAGSKQSAPEKASLEGSVLSSATLEGQDDLRPCKGTLEVMRAAVKLPMEVLMVVAMTLAMAEGG